MSGVSGSFPTAREIAEAQRANRNGRIYPSNVFEHMPLYVVSVDPAADSPSYTITWQPETTGSITLKKKGQRIIDMLRREYEGEWKYIPKEKIWKDMNSNRRHARAEDVSYGENGWVRMIRIIPDNVVIWWKQNE
jgi:hypothetical protein